MNLRTIMLFWPDFWPLVRSRVRGAHAVAIYGGDLHAVDRWGNETWKEAATRYLNQLGSDKDREQMHRYVSRKLEEHARHSKFDLYEDKPCSECQLSWQLIAKACARGDRQERMLVTNRSLLG